MTFGQLLITLEELKKEGDVFMTQDVTMRIDGESYDIDLASTLPGREISFIYSLKEADDAS